jgi:transcriptional regulator with XRE-family HTH domain
MRQTVNLEENDWQALYESLKGAAPSERSIIPPACESLEAGEKAGNQPADGRRWLAGRGAGAAARAGARDGSTAVSEAGCDKARAAPSRRRARSGLGQVLRKRRHELGLTQRQLAARVGVKPAHIAYLEGDRRRPSLGLLSRIAAALGLEREELFALSHPEASLLLRPRRQAKTPAGKNAAWAEFTRDRTLLARNRIKPRELEILAKVNLLGKVSAPRNYLFILNAIRQAVDEE